MSKRIADKDLKNVAGGMVEFGPDQVDRIAQPAPKVEDGGSGTSTGSGGGGSGSDFNPNDDDRLERP